MAFTAAERAKRYRERLKSQNPEKFEEQRKKQLKRLKSNRKTIQDLTEDEKIERRKKWREEKKRKKVKPDSAGVGAKTMPHKRMATKSPPVKKPTNPLLKIRYNKILLKYTAALKKIDKANMRVEAIRKKYYRYKMNSKKEMDKLHKKIEKMTIRQEILELSLRDTYGRTKTQKEKKNMKAIAVNEITKKARTTATAASFLGLKGRIRFSTKKMKLNKTIKDELEEFYKRDDVSRSTAGKRETRTKGKKKEQIRYLTDTLQNLHQKYKDEGGQHSLTTFHRYKPFYILSPLVKNRDTCLCIKHSNVEYLFIALKKINIIGYSNLNEVVSKAACDTKAYSCMYNKCKDCNSFTLQYNKEKINEQVTWYKWQRVTHSYQKLGKTMETKKTIKGLISGTVQELITEFEKELLSFKTHYYNWKQQVSQYQSCIQNLNDKEIAILCDFSENYESKLGTEIQSMHFGASKQSITLHCGMIYFHDQSKSFVSVSDSTCHEPNAIWAHLLPVIKFARQINPKIEIVHFFSDGPSSQYRQKKNFYLTNLFTTKLNLSYSTWSFSESGHGKGVADGIGGSTKRQLDRMVAYGHDVKDGNEAYDHLKKTMKSVECFFVSEKDIDNVKHIIPSSLTAVPETMKLHQIVSEKIGQIAYRHLSCFCGDKHGLCYCFSPKVHIFPKKKEITRQISALLNNIEATMPSGGRHIEDIATRDVINVEQNESENIFANNKISACEGIDLEQVERQSDQDLIELQDISNNQTFDDDYNLPQIELRDFNNIGIDVFDCGEWNQDLSSINIPDLDFTITDNKQNILKEISNSDLDVDKGHLIDQGQIGLQSHSSATTNTVSRDKQIGTLARQDCSSLGNLKRKQEMSQPKVLKRVKVLMPIKSQENRINSNIIAHGGNNSSQSVHQLPCPSKIETNLHKNPPKVTKNDKIIKQQNVTQKCKSMPIKSQSENRINSNIGNDNGRSVHQLPGPSKIETNLKKNPPKVTKNDTVVNQKSVAQTYKSLRTVVSRKFLCKLCNRQKLFISHDMIKCNVCKNWVCKSCSDDQLPIEYICGKCLGS